MTIPFPTKRLHRLMNFIMFTSSYYQKIFNSIVVSNFINVVNMLAIFKIPAKMFFHNQPMFKFPVTVKPYLNVTSLMNSLVSFWSMTNSTLPNRGTSAFRMWNSPTRTMSGAIFSLTRNRLKLFMTIFTLNVGKFFHNSIINPGVNYGN
jgi:hypothetical protein